MFNGFAFRNLCRLELLVCKYLWGSYAATQRRIWRLFRRESAVDALPFCNIRKVETAMHLHLNISGYMASTFQSSNLAHDIGIKLKNKVT
jgi:hypothetical protein